MKKLIFLGKMFAFSGFLTLFFINATTRCRCGEKANGTTSYQVEGENSDCCDGLVALSTNAYEHTWLQQGNGVWQVNTTAQIPPGDAQSDCCEQNT